VAEWRRSAQDARESEEPRPLLPGGQTPPPRLPRARARRGTIALFLLFGVGAAVAMGVTDAIAPCDPNAPIMSFDSSREMPQPYGITSFLLNAAAPVAFGLAAGIAVRKWRFGIGFVTWLLSGFALYSISVQIWQHTCPP
jgi:hypothetical protein